jgi:hypothetical protein
MMRRSTYGLATFFFSYISNYGSSGEYKGFYNDYILKYSEGRLLKILSSFFFASCSAVSKQFKEARVGLHGI